MTRKFCRCLPRPDRRHIPSCAAAHPAVDQVLGDGPIVQFTGITGKHRWNDVDATSRTTMVQGKKNLPPRRYVAHGSRREIIATALQIRRSALIGMFLAAASAVWGLVTHVADTLKTVPTATLSAPAVIDVGGVTPGSVTSVFVEVRNESDAAQRIVGAVPDCSCVAPQNLPIEISAGESVSVALRLVSRDTPGQFTQSVRIFYGRNNLRVLPVEIRGTIGP